MSNEVTLDAAVKARGRGTLEEETRVALDLVGAALTRLSVPAVVHTTDEETGLLAEACQAAQLRIELAPEGRLSAIVGDVVRHGRISSAGVSGKIK